MKAMVRWRPVLVSVLACAVSVSFGTPTRAQERNVEDQGAAAALVAQRGVLAESILAAKEEARGEAFDAALRASLKSRMEALSAEQLAALAEKGAFANIPKVLGATGNDLVYTPVTPCRVFDSRVSQGGPGPIPANAQRNVLVAGTLNFPLQGGLAGGCGVPVGATSAIINFVSVTPSGAGNLRAWAVASPQPVAPLAAVMNFGVVAGLPALANGIAVPICDPAATSCAAGDLRLQADTSGTEVVGDVVGYFRAPTSVPGLLLTQLQGELFLAAATPAGYLNIVTNYVPPVNARAFTFMRCSKFGTAVGQNLQFRSAFRSPTVTGAPTVGSAFYLDATTSGTGTNSVFAENNDSFLLTAGQSYDFGVNFASVPPASSGWCSAVVQVFTR